MRRFLLILLIALLALPALAEDAPAFSQDALLLQSANRALEARYGLTPALLGLFDVEITHYGDVCAVRYLPRSRPHPRLTGEYLVLIAGEQVQAMWTHDSVDPAVWQGGALTSPAWGAPQLLAYLTAGSFDREYFDEPYYTALPPDRAAFPEDGFRGIEYRTGDLTEQEIAAPAAIGRAAVQAMYGLPDAAAAEMHLVNVVKYIRDDGYAVWGVHFYHSTEPDEINYVVRIDAESCEILTVTVITGGIG
ncbi:MAG: hypothetical protein IJE07_12645 [Clostridia bacterium]|nr:hypothetical protein [Clostridia bacterium]